MLFAQAQDAQAGAKAVLRMDSAFKDVGDNAGRIRPGLFCSEDQSLRRPLSMFAMFFWHVLDLSGMAAFVLRAQRLATRWLAWKHSTRAVSATR